MAERNCVRAESWASTDPRPEGGDARGTHRIRGEWLAGAPYAQIARKYGIDPRTAKRYAVNNLSLSELGSRSRSKLDPHRKRIERWVQEESVTITEIRRRLEQSGCPCGYMTVSDYLAKMWIVGSDSPIRGDS